jgi:hypothetical protein
MCGGGGGASEELAKQDAARQEQKEARIRAGMQQLDQIFGGGKYGMNAVKSDAAFDPNQTYYDASGNVLKMKSPVDYYGPETVQANPGDWNNQRLLDWTKKLQWDEWQKNGAFTGSGESGGFNPEFYNKAYQAQLDYAKPQVEDQFVEAQRQLNFALRRQGIDASSQAGEKQAQLQAERAKALQNEEIKAQGVKTSLQDQVENERDALVAMLNQTGNAQNVVNSARTRAGALSSAPHYEAVGPLFQNATAGLVDLVANPYIRQQEGLSSPGYGRKPGGSGKVIGD